MDPKDCKFYMSILEDIVEALCGGIKQILNKYGMARGVGNVAVYNLIASFR